MKKFDFPKIFLMVMVQPGHYLFAAKDVVSGAGRKQTIIKTITKTIIIQ